MKKIILGIIPTLCGLILLFMYFTSLNLVYGYIGIPCLGTGSILLWLGLKNRNVSMNLSGIKTIGKKESADPINSITFYARKLDEKEKPVMCKFEHRDNLTGIQWKSRDWNEYYYINVNIPANGETSIEETAIKPIFEVLPDKEYHSPKAVLKPAYLPANTELARHLNDKDITLSVWVLFAVIVVELIGLIIIP